MSNKSLLTQPEAAEVLANITGEKWDRRKFHLYRQRGVIPEPDEYTGLKKHPLWYRETIEKYARERLK